MTREKHRRIEREIQQKVNFYDASIAILAAIVFAISLSIRLLLDLAFFLRYGWHASNVPELWFYFGVAEGIFKLKSLDPTLWILRALGYVFPENFLFYSVVLTAGILSSITAVIILFIGAELGSKKTGFLAGIVYATMIQPIGLSVVSFTHDLVQLPVIALSILLLIRSIKTPNSKEKIINSTLFIVLLYLGWHINQLITVAVDVAVLLFGLELFYRLGEKYKIGRERTFLYYSAAVAVGILASRLTFLPGIFDEVFQRMAQGRIGSIDVTPISVGSLWTRYNFLWLFVPLGLMYSHKRRDIASYSLFLIGLVTSTLIDRGARVLDLAVPLLVAHAFADWDKKDEMALALGFFLVVPFAISYLGFSMLLNMFFIVMGVGLFFLLKSQKQRMEFPSIFLVLMLVSGIITFSSVASPKFIKEAGTTDSEYSALVYLKGVSKENEKIHINWVYGYFARAISGATPASSPGRINRDLFEASWQTEKMGAEKFRDEGIDYVIVTTRDFEIIKEDPKRDIAYFKIGSGIIFRPNSDKLSSLKRTTIYKMLYDEEGLNNFEKIYEETDRTGLVVKIFRVL